MGAGGRTWVVAGTGHGRCFPPEHAGTFDEVARGPGAMIWPFPAGYSRRSAFLSRNKVLAALSDFLVVAQAGLASGALHAASCARTLRRPLWGVPMPPWLTHRFEGSSSLLQGGARPLVSGDSFVTLVRRSRSSSSALAPPMPTPRAPPPPPPPFPSRQAYLLP